jgi:hypothetical protein
LPLATIQGDLNVSGRVVCQSLQAPANSIGNAAIESNAAIDATKLVHQWTIPYRQVPGTPVAADTFDIHIAKFSGTIVAIEAVITGAIATGGDRTITIDLLKSTGAAAFATVMSGALVLDNTNVLRTVESGSISDTAFIADDLLRVTIAVAGAAGAQANGLLIVLTLRENAQ